jgi:hypothetical protein
VVFPSTFRGASRIDDATEKHWLLLVSGCGGDSQGLKPKIKAKLHLPVHISCMLDWLAYSKTNHLATAIQFLPLMNNDYEQL